MLQKLLFTVWADANLADIVILMNLTVSARAVMT